jgi:Family of unknown function (DUF695)
MRSESATYTGFEFEADGFPAFAIINMDLKNASKEKYPYSVFIQIIPDTYNENGHPEEKEDAYLVDIEKKIIDYLETQTETVHVGHITIYRSREIIFYTNSEGVVETFLDHFLSTIERESSFEIEEDINWENVSVFYKLL